jgi:NADP-reducing hydrogenase subunit HndB
MAKIKSVKELQELKEKLKIKSGLYNKDAGFKQQPVHIKVAMATCSIASGAKETLDYFIEETDNMGVDAVITPTGCMGFCYAEPTVEVTLPGKEPVMFGFVDTLKAKEIIERYILHNEDTEGVIPVNYETI